MAGTKWTGTVPFDKVQIKEALRKIWNTKKNYGSKCLFRNLSPICRGVGAGATCTAMTVQVFSGVGTAKLLLLILIE